MSFLVQNLDNQQKSTIDLSVCRSSPNRRVSASQRRHARVDEEHRVGFLKKKGTVDTPLKINMEHNHGGLEDHFPF